MIPRSEPSDSTESSSDRSHRSRDGGSAPPLPLIRESDSYLADGSARRSSWSTAAPPEAARPPGLIGHPHAVRQLGLADIQRRDPLNNLLTVGRLLQHPAPPILSGGEQQDLIRVLEATPKGPHTAPGNPARSRPPATIDTRRQRATTNFQPGTGVTAGIPGARSPNTPSPLSTNSNRSPRGSPGPTLSAPSGRTRRSSPPVTRRPRMSTETFRP